MAVKGIFIILLIFFVAASFSCFYPQIENFFVFYPVSGFDGSPGEIGLKAEDIYFRTDDKTKLHGWFFPGQEGLPVMLFCHGNAGNISHRLDNIKFLLDRGLPVFIFDYRGYGKSGGRPSEGGLYRDGLAAYDFLVNEKSIPGEMILIFGRSLGAAVAIEIALNRKIRALIIESAFTSSKGMAQTLFPFNLISFLLPPHYNNREKIARIKVPKLMIHGEDDDIVPFYMAQELFGAAQPPKYFYPIKNAGHNDTYLIGGRPYFETLSAFAKNSRL